MRLRDRLAALIAAAGVGTILATAGAAVASAHDTLDGTDPAQGATVTSLTAVSLSFSADPLGTDGAAVIRVIGPDKRYYESACPDLNGPVVSSPVALGEAGTYEVLWRVVSSDGHPISGSYTFSYSPGGSATPAASGSAKPVCGPAASAETEAPAVGAAADPGLWVGLGIGAVVLVGVGAGAWALARGRKSEG